jgi:protein ImuB
MVPEELTALQAALGWWALQFTPRVALQDEAVLLELSGSERLFGGRAALLQLILAPPAGLEIMAWAQGDTALLALARLRLKSIQTTAEPAPESPIDTLPLHTLSAAREHLATLARLGCNTWGGLRALPRGGVVRRFGAALLDALDCALGLRHEAHRWLVAPEVFAVKLELHAQVEVSGALLFVAQRLLAQLQAWLLARQSGVLALQWTWFYDARRSSGPEAAAYSDALVIRTAEATRDIGHLARLTAEQLSRCVLACPVHSLQLQSLEVVPLPTASFSLLLEERLAGDSLHQLVERLGARLGTQQVVCLQARAEHRPEHLQYGSEAAQAMQKKSFGKGQNRASVWSEMPNAALYPAWLLEQPLRLAIQAHRPLYQGALQLLVGPQRLEVMGWEQADAPVATLRDYFIALSPHAGLLWVYRERLPQGRGSDAWYLHGIYA